jgi:hypothetical protein
MEFESNEPPVLSCVSGFVVSASTAALASGLLTDQPLVAGVSLVTLVGSATYWAWSSIAHSRRVADAPDDADAVVSVAAPSNLEVKH